MQQINDLFSTTDGSSKSSVREGNQYAAEDGDNEPLNKRMGSLFTRKMWSKRKTHPNQPDRYTPRSDQAAEDGCRDSYQ